MAKPIQLHLGYVGITREGKKVTLEGKTNLNTTYPFTCVETGDSYTKHGFYYYSREETDMDIIGPWVEPVFKLHVGYVGITRSGLKVTLSRLSADKYPFKDLESGNSYSAEGYYWFDKHPSSFDIVGPWVGPVPVPVQPPWVEPKVDIEKKADYTKYNNGKYFQLRKGVNPVHPKTEVTYKQLSCRTGEIETYTRLAEKVYWGSTVRPILAFKVTKHYEEPKEFWISKLTSKAYVENPNYPSYYTHVKEVL
jgi:hypothetical protein